MQKPLLAAACVAALGAGATAVIAQEAPPTVTVGLGKTQVSVQGADGLKGGPTRFVFTNPDKLKENFGGVFALKSGASIDDFKRAVATKGQNGAWGVATLEASASFQGASTSRAMTADLQPGANYVAFQGAGEDPKKWVYTPLTVAAQRNGATMAKPAATVDMDDFVFRGSTTLPRKGKVRFRNVGAAPHFAVAFPLKKGASTKAAARALRTNNDKALQRLLGGAPSEPQGIVSPGSVNDSEVSFAKAGRYMLVCFFSTRETTRGHNQIGMYRAVQVR